MREIGSEFWLQRSSAQSCYKGNEVHLLSGRTALRLIIDDIFQNHNFRRVLLPSYCCESMIEPFISKGIEVQFYQTHKDCVDYPYENNADVVLLLDFFGYINPENEKIAYREKEAGKIVIYDATHKIDGNLAVEFYADYSFCSYRKWFYCNYAVAVKHDSFFCTNLSLKKNNEYVHIRNCAAQKKWEYMTGIIDKKDEYLALFSKAEQMLDLDYVGYEGTAVSFNITEIVSKRRENAMYLIGKLKEIPQIELWRDVLQEEDTPLFVPILVEHRVRNDLRNALIKESIYCPIHWPVSSYHKDCNHLYYSELSLVCDQRYELADMERVFQVIKKFFE